MSTTRFSLFVAAILTLAAWAHADTIVTKLTVDAGQIARKNAPITARIEGKTVPANEGAWELVSSPNTSPAIAAQVERLGDGALVARWIEPDLQPGKPKTYELVARTQKPAGGLRFVEGAGWRDLTYNGKGIWRHMNRYDAADHANTFKPFHHIYGMHGEGFITNGPGSEEWGPNGQGILYPHHRGLYFGYNRTPYGDFWHGTNGVSQQHRKYDPSRQFAGSVVAREAGICEWVAGDGKAVIRDTREVTAWRVSDTQLILDFDVLIESLTGEAISLGGDAQHAGFHFRAADAVAKAPATQPGSGAAASVNAGGNAIYTRPATANRTGSDVWSDCPWVHCAFVIKGNRYGVTEMNSPGNPTPIVFSTRPYGRFGAFFADQSAAPDKPLKLKFRFIIRDAAQTPDAKALEVEYQDYVTPVSVTVAK